MILTVDNDMARLINSLKWTDWGASYTLAVAMDAEREVLSARVVTDADDINLLAPLLGVRADHWTIGDLFMDLLTSVAYGFAMSRPTGSHRYVLALLEAIRRHEDGQDE